MVWTFFLYLWFYHGNKTRHYYEEISKYPPANLYVYWQSKPIPVLEHPPPEAHDSQRTQCEAQREYHCVPHRDLTLLKHLNNPPEQDEALAAKSHQFLQFYRKRKDEILEFPFAQSLLIHEANLCIFCHSIVYHANKQGNGLLLPPNETG